MIAKQQMQASILIVDDNPHNLKVLSQQIKDAGWRVAIAKNGETAIAQAKRQPPVLILLDVLMPVIDGFETCKRLKSIPETREIPIIFMTALTDTENKVKGFAVGGVDYITKPFQEQEVIARINLHTKLYFLTKKLETQNEILEERVNEKTAELLQSLCQLQEAKAGLERSFEEVKKAKEIAESADRAKSEFLGNMSHELLTPLNAIIGYSELLPFIDKNLSPRVIEGLQSIHSAGQELSDLVNNILTISEAEKNNLELHPESFDLGKLLQEVLEKIQVQAAENNNQLEAKLGEVLTIYADRSKVRQILEQILDNAYKFTHNGTIALTLSRRSDLDKPSIMIEVQDTGIGIPEDYLNSIFLPFTQVDGSIRRRYNGAGLGLAIAQTLCQLVGGEITVKSKISEGSTFTISLPTDSGSANSESAK